MIYIINMQKLKKIIFWALIVLVGIVLFFIALSVLYRFTGVEKTQGGIWTYILPAQAYPLNAQECLAASGYKHIPEFTTTPSCQFENSPKIHTFLLHCPPEGRIIKTTWCGDFSCSEPMYSCRLEFLLEPESQSPEFPEYTVPSPDTVYLLARQFDTDVTKDEFYMMSNAELYFTYGQYLSRQQQLPYQQGYILLSSYNESSDPPRLLNIQKKLREAGFVTYDPKQQWQQPGLSSFFYSDFLGAKQHGVKVPFDTIRIEAVAGLTIEKGSQLSETQIQQLETIITQIEKGAPSQEIQCEIIYTVSNPILIDCYHGYITEATLEKILSEISVTQYKSLRYGSVLVPYGQEEYWGKILQEWDAILEYELVMMPKI